MGQGEKLMDFRQPSSPEAEKEGERETCGGLLVERGDRREREGAEEGAVKTQTSNLVHCVKKSRMHSRPRGPTLLPCGHDGH